MVTITGGQIGIILGLISIIGTILGIVFWVQKPQRTLETRVQTLEDEHKTLKSEHEELKKLHYENNDIVKKELKENTTALNDLAKTVVKLSTIIDERIPKGSPMLTPPGK